MKNKTLKHIFISFVISAFCVMTIVLIEQMGLLSFLEQKTLDLRIQNRDGQDKGNDDVVIILVDEASLQSMKSLVGRWPWPRSLFAELNFFLAEQGAKAVLYDILFTEPQTARNEEGELGADDIDLVASSIDNPHVIHAAQLLKESESREENLQLGIPLPSVFVEKFGLTVAGNFKIFEIGNNNFYLPIPELYENISGIGIVEFLPDSDGVFRRTKLLRGYQNNFFPVLSMASLIHINPDRQFSIEKNYLNWGDIAVPLMPNGDYLVNPKKEFQTLSIGGVFSTIQQIQEGNFENLILDPEIFKDKIVLIGASAVGVEDLKPTSYGPNFPGVYLHASIISNLKEKDFIKRVPLQLEVILTFFIAFIVAFLITSRINIYYKSIIPIAIILAYLYLVFQLFNLYQFWMSAVFPILGGMLAVYASSFIYMAFTEGRERLKTKRMFSQFVSPSVLSEVMETRSSLTSEIGAKEELSVLFSDIRGFTAFSETLKPEKVVELLNFYLHEMVELVFKYNGTLDKFIGDAVMAFWGAPIKDDNHAEQSVQCAMNMISQLKKVNRHFSDKDLPEIKIGIGINSGPMIVGNIGSVKRLDYTVIGDNVNLASRIEGLTKSYECSIIISESTKKLLNDDFICRIIDRVRVKGKNEPIVLYEPLAGPEHDTSARAKAKTIASLSDSAFKAYRDKNWDIAIKAYQDLSEIIVNDTVCDVFINRCKEYRQKPPSDSWDGTYSFTTK